MATIYELKSGYIELMMMAEDGEVDEQALHDTMEALEGEIEDKADGCAMIMKELDAKAEIIDKEIKRLQERKKSLENRSDWIKKSLQELMILSGKTKFKTTLFNFSIAKNPASVRLDTEDLAIIPERFLKYVEPSIDKTAIKDALKNGEDLTGIAHLEQTESLRIK